VVRDTVSSNSAAELSIKINTAYRYKDRKFVLYVQPGDYRISGPLNLGNGAQNVVIRGITGNPEDVRVWGRGFNNRGGIEPLLNMSNFKNIILAHMTFRSAAFNGVKVLGDTGVGGILIYNCHFRDIGERGIKSITGGINGGEVRFCTFKCDSIHPTGYDDGFNGDYIAGMDLKEVFGWKIHQNVFENIRGTTGGGRAGIFIWSGSRDVVVESNMFMGCDRAIALGNSSASGRYTVENGIVRNNFICAGAGRAIELCLVHDVDFHNNTIYNTATTRQPFDQAVFLDRATQVKVNNNIIMGKIHVYSGDSADTSRNIHYADRSWFANVNVCDLHLTAQGSPAVDGGITITDLIRDIDGCQRQDSPDIGADEYGHNDCAAARTFKGNTVTEKPGYEIAAYPNPLSTSVKIQVNSATVSQFRSSTVTRSIKIFNIKGRFVSRLDNCGTVELWNCGTSYTWHPQGHPNGIYLIHANVGDRKLVSKITLRR
jgi:hypothetical protein